MPLKHVLLSLLGILIIVVLPHLNLIPLFGYSIPIILLVWLFLKQAGENFKDIGFSWKRFEIKSLLIGIPTAILSLAFMQLVFFPGLELLVELEASEASIYDFLKANPFQFVFTLIMGIIIGGLYEEIVFHGFIFTRLERMIPGKYATALAFAITSLLFGGYHYQLGMAGTINAFLIGMVYLGLFLAYKRNLWYSIVAHGTYNTIVISMIYVGWL